VRSAFGADFDASPPGAFFTSFPLNWCPSHSFTARALPPLQTNHRSLDDPHFSSWFRLFFSWPHLFFLFPISAPSFGSIPPSKHSLSAFSSYHHQEDLKCEAFFPSLFWSFCLLPCWFSRFLADVTLAHPQLPPLLFEADSALLIFHTLRVAGSFLIPPTQKRWDNPLFLAIRRNVLHSFSFPNTKTLGHFWNLYDESGPLFFSSLLDGIAAEPTVVLNQATFTSFQQPPLHVLSGYLDPPTPLYRRDFYLGLTIYL